MHKLHHFSIKVKRFSSHGSIIVKETLIGDVINTSTKSEYFILSRDIKSVIYHQDIELHMCVLATSCFRYLTFER